MRPFRGFYSADQVTYNTERLEIEAATEKEYKRRLEQSNKMIRGLGPGLPWINASQAQYRLDNPKKEYEAMRDADMELLAHLEKEQHAIVLKQQMDRDEKEQHATDVLLKQQMDRDEKEIIDARERSKAAIDRIVAETQAHNRKMLAHLTGDEETELSKQEKQQLQEELKRDHNKRMDNVRRMKEIEGRDGKRTKYQPPPPPPPPPSDVLHDALAVLEKIKDEIPAIEELKEDYKDLRCDIESLESRMDDLENKNDIQSLQSVITYLEAKIKDLEDKKA